MCVHGNQQVSGQCLPTIHTLVTSCNHSRSSTILRRQAHLILCVHISPNGQHIVHRLLLPFESSENESSVILQKTDDCA
jgi:hypothetical protein